MSEYQYYEFLAIDQQLSEDDMDWLRAFSTRAQITTTSFTNVYHWGDFRGDPQELMLRCFDAFVYVTNFGARQFSIRLPRGTLDANCVMQYAHKFVLSVLQTQDYILLDFICEEEPGMRDGWDDGTGWIASLIPLRMDLVNGDFRSLYLTWLGGIQDDQLPDESEEPPVPPGLKQLTPPLHALIAFLNIDPALLEIAAERSMPSTTVEQTTEAMKDWIHSLSTAERNDLLLNIAAGYDPNPRLSLMQRFRKSTHNCQTTHVDKNPNSTRSVSEIKEQWRRRFIERNEQRARQEAIDRRRQERKEALARKKHLEEIASRIPKIWKQVEACIETRSQKEYDQAVTLLVDLKDAAYLSNDTTAFNRRLLDIRDRNANKPSLMRRFRDAGLNE